MLEECTEALKRWHKWKKSLEIARAKMESKYDNVANVIAGASLECEIIEEGTSSETVRLFVNSKQWTKWKLNWRMLLYMFRDGTHKLATANPVSFQAADLVQIDG